MRQLTTKELQQTSGGLSSADIMGFLRGLFGGSEASPSKPWTPPSTPASTGANMGGVIGALVVGTAALLATAAAAAAFGLSKWLDSSAR
ncbi:bacteriocin [Serratia proteamaculans]|uniref:Bacteriocin n=1 Tax=Serratia proteamaculans TaxID=28151 RepID=A0A5Q2VKJ2_SERPR|nr:bacteriocin [Serratia proteamaculans]QGH63923.1 bacteriocin [Serratia proteamaculans]